MLAVVFGITRFHTYLYVSPFQMKTDHEPLEIVLGGPSLKSLTKLQRMIQKMQGYDVTIEYRQEKTMANADTLSRLPNSNDKDEIEWDLRVDGVYMSVAEFNRFDLYMVNY